jgi:hypothetical protein
MKAQTNCEPCIFACLETSQFDLPRCALFNAAQLRS